MAEWRQLDWLPDYEISEDGLVCRTTNSRRNSRFPKGYIVKGYMAGSRKSYRYYKLMLPDGSQRKFTAHSLVCEAWHGKAPEGTEVAHGDGNPANNTPSNLRWATKADNFADHEKHSTLHRNQKGRFNAR